MRRKLALVFVLVAVISTTMVGTYGLFSSLREAEERIETEYTAQSRIIAQNIEHSLEHTQQDVLFLSLTPPIQGIIRARDGGGYDSFDGSTYEVWVERLQAIFEGMMPAKKVYMQLRYLDEAGNELVRVDYDGRQTRRVLSEELQNKAGSYYFTETMNLDIGQIYVSPLDLNREQGQIEAPYKPTIRYATPVFDSQGERRGLVIANVLAITFLHTDLMFPHSEQAETFIADREGYYLHHSAHPDKEWGSPVDLGSGHGLRRDFPALADHVLSGQAGEAYSDDGRIIFYARSQVYPDPERFWVVGVVLPRAVAYASLPSFSLAFGGIFLAALAVAMGTAYVFARRLTVPLEALRRGVRQLAAGDLSQRVEVTSGDEIEELAGDFNLMAEELQRRVEHSAVLNEIARAISSTLEIDAMFPVITKAVQPLIPFDRASVALLDEGGETQTVFALRTEATGSELGHGVPMPVPPVVQAVVASRRGLLRPDLAESDDPVDRALVREGIRTALVAPLISKDQAIGTFNLGSRKLGAYTEEHLSLLQAVADQIAQAVENARLYDQVRDFAADLERNYETQRVVSSLLHISLRDIPLEEILNHALDLILSIPWLAFESRGGIFLIEDEPEVLVLKAQKGLGEPVQKTCAQVPFGRCLCGRAALTQEIQFTDSLDDRHETRYEGIVPHGHYCVPILSADKVVGVMTLYLREGHHRNPREEEFISAVANALAGIIERKRTEEALRKSEASLVEAQRIAHLGNWDWDITNNELRWSDEIYRIFGLAPQQFGATYEAFLNSVHPDDRELVTESVNEALYESKPYSVDHRIVLPDGSERVVHEQAEVLRDESGRAIRMVGTIQDITERKRVEEERARLRRRLEALWEMARLVDADYSTLCNHVLAEIVALTQSGYGFYGFLDEDESVMTVYSWSGEAMEECQIRDKPIEYSIVEAGLWGDAVRHRRTLIINDYQADHPSKKGLPDGHVSLSRILAVPIFSHGRIVALAAVANRATEYTEEDAEQINAFVTSAQAILDRRQAEDALKEAEQRYRELVEGLDAIVWEADAQTWQFTFVSQRAETISGYPVDQWLSEPNFWVDHIHPEDRDETASFCQLSTQEGRDHEIEYRMIKADGSTVWLRDVIAVETSEGLPVRLKGLMVDITEHKRVEELRIAKEAAEAANQAKSQFLANMSHELRTPLNAVIGFSEVLQEQYFGELNDKQAGYVGDILDSGKHLLSLINDVLDLSKIEAGKEELEFSQVNVTDLLENSLVMIREKCFKHDINLDLHVQQQLTDFEITADERKLRQVMFNLLSNAAKFTPDGGAITVEAKQEGEELFISVADTGIGIDPEHQEKIFEEFYQVRGGMKDKTPGTGLGLSLTNRFVEMHGGRLWVESEGEGKGSCFSFTLPLKKGQENDSLR